MSEKFSKMIVPSDPEVKKAADDFYKRNGKVFKEAVDGLKPEAELEISAICVKCDRIRITGYKWPDIFVDPKNYKNTPGVICPQCRS